MFPAPRSAGRHALLESAAVYGGDVLGLGTAAARAASPGTLDSSFGSGGVAVSGAGMRLFGTAVQSDGKVVAVGESLGSSPDVMVARFTPSGGLDSSFGSGGVAHGPSIGGSVGRGVAIQSDGKIVVVGSATDSSGNFTHGLIVERYNSNGSLDTGFGSTGSCRSSAGARPVRGTRSRFSRTARSSRRARPAAAGSNGTCRAWRWCG